MTPDRPAALPQIGLPPAQFAAAFPFHMAMDRSLAFVQIGATLGRICADVRPGGTLAQSFRSLQPAGTITFDWVLENRLRFFLLQHRASGLKLRGEFVLQPDQDVLIFLGSPWFTDATEIADHRLHFDDFAIHDPVVDMLQVFQASKQALADAKRLAAKLTAQRAELRIANERLRLQEAEARKLALIAARTDNAVLLTDEHGLTVWGNEGFTRMSGYAVEDLLGRKPGSVLQGPGTDPGTVRRISQSLRRGESFREEILNYAKGGHGYWVSIEVQPIRDVHDRITNFMAIMRDVTAERAAQQRLAIQFEVSRALAEAGHLTAAVPDVIESVCKHLGWQIGQMWRADGLCLRYFGGWHSPAMPCEKFISTSRAMTFAPHQGLPGRVWATRQPAWIPDVTRDENFPRIFAAVVEDLHGAFAFPVMVRGEPWGVVEFFSRRIEEPDEALLQTFAAVGSQIGQFIVRRAAEEALRETNTLQRAILDGANYSIISTAPDGIIQTFNSAAGRMLGYAPEEMVGRVTPAIIHDRDEVAARAAELSRELGRPVAAGFETFVAKVAMGKPDEREWTYIRKDGSRFPVLLSVTALFDEANTVTGYLGVAFDITESKRAADELLRAKDAAEAANRAKSQFLANMSHELRTPLNAIIGFSQLLDEAAAGELNARQARYVENIHSSGRHLLELINDILDLAKVEAGHMRVERAPFIVAAALRNLQSILSSLAKNKQILIGVRVDPELPPIHADERKLKQILYNLLSNAIKFTPEGGEVTVTAAFRKAEADPAARPAFEFTVTDNGIGIRPEDQARVFQPFEQADSSYTKTQQGTGLGLALVQQLVHLHDGRLTLESDGVPGHGCTFRFTIPQPPADGAAPGPAPAKSRPVVLIADDDPAMVKCLASLVEQAGFDSLQAFSGAQCLEMARRYLPAAITLDLRLPDLTGAAVLEQLQVYPESRGIPVIIVTGLDPEGPDLIAIKRHAHALVTKPDVHSVVPILQNLLASLR